MNARILVGLIWLSLIFGGTTSVSAAEGPAPPWRVMLGHDAEGEVLQGNMDRLVGAVRQGCQLRIAWGARGLTDPTRTIEHVVAPDWVSVRNSTTVEAQISGFTPNLDVLGEPPEDHPRRERFGGTEKLVSWRASVRTDGNFNAVWYAPQSGALMTRMPQRHPMVWFADCEPALNAKPLFPPAEE